MRSTWRAPRRLAEDAWTRVRAAPPKGSPERTEPEALFGCRRFRRFSRRGSSASDAFSFGPRDCASATYGGEARPAASAAARPRRAPPQRRRRRVRVQSLGNAGTDGDARMHPPRSPPGFVSSPRGGGVLDPEAMLWPQQQQMVFQQRRLQLAQQQQRRAHAGLPFSSQFSRIVGAGERFRRRRRLASAAERVRLVRRNAVEEVTRLVETRSVSVHQLDAEWELLLMWACALGTGAGQVPPNEASTVEMQPATRRCTLLGGHGELGAHRRQGQRTRPRRTTGARRHEGMVRIVMCALERL